MKYLFILLTSIYFYSCQQPVMTSDTTSLNKDSLKQVLIDLDKSWSDASLKTGFYHSRSQFSTVSSVELMQNEMPLIGTTEMNDYAISHPDSSFSLQWTPLRADVAGSGDLGYTYGAWTMKKKTKMGTDTTLYGDYITVWQKQEDGLWKFVADGGSDTPQEVSK